MLSESIEILSVKNACMQIEMAFNICNMLGEKNVMLL